MIAAVILLWAGCLWAIIRSVLFLLTASPWRQLLVLAILLLAASCAHKPVPRIKPNARTLDGKNNK